MIHEEALMSVPHLLGTHLVDMLAFARRDFSVYTSSIKESDSDSNISTSSSTPYVAVQGQFHPIVPFLVNIAGVKNYDGYGPPVFPQATSYPLHRHSTHFGSYTYAYNGLCSTDTDGFFPSCPS